MSSSLSVCHDSVVESRVLSQAAWFLVRQFAGIYGVKMEYTKIKSLSSDKISHAYFDAAKQPRFVSTIRYSCSGMPEKILKIKPKEWKDKILKSVARGHKNRKFYETLAIELTPPKKILCVCGLHMGNKPYQVANHYSSKYHTNRMLNKVSINQLDTYLNSLNEDDLDTPLAHPHIPTVSGYSIQYPYFFCRNVDVVPYIYAREMGVATRPSGHHILDTTYGDLFMDITNDTVLTLAVVTEMATAQAPVTS